VPKAKNARPLSVREVGRRLELFIMIGFVRQIGWRAYDALNEVVLKAMPFNPSFNSQPKAYLLPFTYAFG
jgi:hypothetical protein